LSSPHLEASPATTFRTCSSPAPTRVKPQPTPAILSQESVHRTLSITHHTRKRPSTGPRTTHGPQPPESDPGTRRCLARTPRRPPPGYLSRVAPLGPPHPCPSHPSPCAPPPPGTLAAAALGPPPSSLPRRREAVQDLRKEVRRPPDSRVVDPTRCIVRRSTPELRRRDVCPLCRVPTASTTLGCFVVPRSAHSCSLRLKPSPETLDWVPPASLAAVGRRPPPCAARTRPRPLN
jgi:hypothetical protein